MSAPYDTPDAVISGSHRYYGKPLGLKPGFIFRDWFRKLLRRKPETQHFMLRIIYREWQERVEVVHFAPGLILPFVDKLLAAPQIRQVFVSEMLFHGRKSFGADYDPERMFEFLKSAADDLKKKDAAQ